MALVFKTGFLHAPNVIRFVGSPPPPQSQSCLGNIAHSFQRGLYHSIILRRIGQECNRPRNNRVVVPLILHVIFRTAVPKLNESPLKNEKFETTRLIYTAIS